MLPAFQAVREYLGIVGTEFFILCWLRRWAFVQIGHVRAVSKSEIEFDQLGYKALHQAN